MWEAACEGGVRTFPPPIGSLLSERPLMRTFKFNGRFVLQRMNTLISTSPFSAIRENGRLRLIPACSSISDHAGELPFIHQDQDHAEYDYQEEDNCALIKKGSKPARDSSVCVPRSKIKLLGHWDAAADHESCLQPTLRLIRMVAQIRLSKLDSTNCMNGMWKGKEMSSKYMSSSRLSMEACTQLGNSSLYDRLGKTSLSSAGLQQKHEGSYCNNIAASAKGNNEQSKRKASKGIKQGYAIISMQFGRSILLLETTANMGTMAKGICLYKYTKPDGIILTCMEEQYHNLFNPPLITAISSSDHFNILKPLDLRLVPITCHWNLFSDLPQYLVSFA